MKKMIVLNDIDNVGNVVEDVSAGDEITYILNGETICLEATSDIPFGFKAALRPIARGGDVIKFKEVIGVASKDIKAGECVHIHNIAGKRGRGDLGGN